MWFEGVFIMMKHPIHTYRKRTCWELFWLELFSLVDDFSVRFRNLIHFFLIWAEHQFIIYYFDGHRNFSPSILGEFIEVWKECTIAWLGSSAMDEFRVGKINAILRIQIVWNIRSYHELNYDWWTTKKPKYSLDSKKIFAVDATSRLSLRRLRLTFVTNYFHAFLRLWAGRNLNYDNLKARVTVRVRE